MSPLAKKADTAGAVSPAAASPVAGEQEITVAQVGTVIRAYRKASGVSQKDLAKWGGVSRATLNYLESGRDDIEVGAGRLFSLLAVLGIPLSIPRGVDRSGDEQLLERTLKAQGKGKKRLAEGDLMEALASGKIPPGTEAALGTFLEGAPQGVGLAALRLASARSGNPAKEISKNARSLAKALHVGGAAWLHGG